MNIMGAENDIHPRVFCLNAVNNMLLLHHTPAYADRKLRIGQLFFLQLSQCAEEPFVRVFPDAASIDDDHVGLIPLRAFAKSHLRKHACDGLRIMFIHLAAEGGNMIRLRLVHVFVLSP